MNISTSWSILLYSLSWLFLFLFSLVIYVCVLASCSFSFSFNLTLSVIYVSLFAECRMWPAAILTVFEWNFEASVSHLCTHRQIWPIKQRTNESIQAPDAIYMSTCMWHSFLDFSLYRLSLYRSLQISIQHIYARMASISSFIHVWNSTRAQYSTLFLVFENGIGQNVYIVQLHFAPVADHLSKLGRNKGPSIQKKKKEIEM